jgi:hypothetical protein
MMRNRVRLANASLASALLLLCVETQTYAQPVNITISSDRSYQMGATESWRLRLPRGTQYKATPSSTADSFNDDDVLVRTNLVLGGHVTVTFKQGSVFQLAAGPGNRITIPVESFVTLPAGTSVTVLAGNLNRIVTLEGTVTAKTVDLLHITLPDPATASAQAAVPAPQRPSILVGILNPAPTVRDCVGYDAWVPAVSAVSPSIPVRCTGRHQRFAPSYLYILPSY